MNYQQGSCVGCLEVSSDAHFEMFFVSNFRIGWFSELLGHLPALTGILGPVRHRWMTMSDVADSPFVLVPPGGLGWWGAFLKYRGIAWNFWRIWEEQKQLKKRVIQRDLVVDCLYGVSWAGQHPFFVLLVKFENAQHIFASIANLGKSTTAKHFLITSISNSGILTRICTYVAFTFLWVVAWMHVVCIK